MTAQDSNFRQVEKYAYAAFHYTFFFLVRMFKTSEIFAQKSLRTHQSKSSSRKMYEKALKKKQFLDDIWMEQSRFMFLRSDFW